MRGHGDALPPGWIARSWCAKRLIGTATVAGSFADIGHSESLAELQRRLIRRVRVSRVDVDDPEFRRALELLGIRLLEPESA